MYNKITEGASVENIKMLQHPYCIGEQGGGVRGGSTPSEKKFYDPPLRFKMTPTPSEMAFDPL